MCHSVLITLDCLSNTLHIKTKNMDIANLSHDCKEFFINLTGNLRTKSSIKHAYGQYTNKSNFKASGKTR